ncbi:MAG: TolC family protein [Bacteroidota bacterium]
MYKIVVCILFTLLISACQSNRYISRKAFADEFNKRSEYALNDSLIPGSFRLPPGTTLENGLTEEEAVNISLWNNARFQTDLADISMANANVTNAAIISNPLLRYLAPTGGIATSGYINFALDFIWQRPQRIAVAKLNADRIADSLMQRGFSLIRDVQFNYADLLAATERLTIIRETAKIRAEMAHLANVRLKYGDISELEASTSRADSASAADDLVQANLNYLLAKSSLNYIMGFTSPDTVISVITARPDTILRKIPVKDYLELAFEYRPEIRAAKVAIEAAGKTLGLERSRIINFTASLNYQYVNANGGPRWLPNAVNPGFQMDIPIFNRNQGNIQRANALLEKASLQYFTVQQNIALDVSQAYHRYEQNYQSYQVWNTNTLPALAETVTLVSATYRRGDISYIPVLEALRQLQNGRLRQAAIAADLRKSISQLNYAIGQNLTSAKP